MYFYFIYIFVILFLFVKCYLHAFRYCILGILGILYTFIFRYVCKMRAILIDRALYKYCIIIIIMSSSPLFLDCEINISVNIFIPIQYFKLLNLISSQSS